MSPVSRIGFVGCPTQEGFSSLIKAGHEVELVDLDNFHPQAERWSARLLPANVCAIIKRIVDNALSLDLDVILFDEGYGKCDHARAAAAVCQEHLDIPVVRTRNDNLTGHGTEICDSRLPVIEKAERILDNLIKPEPFEAVRLVKPPAALWGVPASDFELYKLFPDGTRLLGWFRCLENLTPADTALELEVDPNVPTVFFAQTFCHKNILAKELARKYSGLYVDMDGAITASAKAKIETFLRFYVSSDR
ncbi:MAG: hypothetical protein JRJ87_20450 [Deltaproteobacteria bacterium]|nr:hypothetical protein [Deltaproteobacteria bacterium]